MSDQVMVFAPDPLLTVTIEQRGGDVELHLHPGGQGVWQARMIAALGVPVTICAAIGGEVGDVLERVLDKEQVTVRAVARQSGSGWYVHDRRAGTRTELAADRGRPMVRHDVDELYTVALAEGLASPVSVLSGPADPSVIDPDVYRRLAADLGSNGCQIVADLSGEHLTAVLRGGAAFVKVSDEELLSDRRAEDASTQALVAAGHRLRSEGAGSVLISRSDQPAIALFGDQVTSVHGPPMQTADHRGAGDSMSGAVAAVLARDGSAEDAVRTGAAAGALNVTRSGLGTGRAEAVRELVRRVRLEPIDGGG